MRIHYLLLFPPAETFFIQQKTTFYGLAPPLGLLYLGKLLENNGNQITILDFSAEPYSAEKLLDRVKTCDCVGITVMSHTFAQTQHIVDLIKKVYPTKPIIMGGPHATLFPQQTLQHTKADFIVAGDGEPVIPFLDQLLSNQIHSSEIPGIYYQENNTIKKGKSPEPIKNLDSLPFPARHLVQKYTYGTGYNTRIKQGKFTTILTSRGCPFQCRFCSRGAFSYHQTRFRSISNILEELVEIKEQGYTDVGIMDDCFPIKKTDAESLFDAIIQEQLNLTFYVTGARVDMADSLLYEKMKQAGVKFIQFGLESGNQDVLDFYNKNITLHQIQKAVHLAYETGFFTAGSFILGAPFETKNHFRKTINFAKSLPLHSASFLPLRYMAGSELWEQAVAQNHITENETMITAGSAHNLGGFSEQELVAWCSRGQFEYYARLRFFLLLVTSSLRNNDFSFLQQYLNLLSMSIVSK